MRYVSRAVAVAACAAALAAALWHAPAAFDKANSAAHSLAQASAVDRALTGSHDIDRNFLLQARALLPANARYAIVTGPKVKPANPNTMVALLPFTDYWLLPRVQLSSPRGAQWILSYGGDLHALGLRYARVVVVSPGISIAQVSA